MARKWYCEDCERWYAEMDETCEVVRRGTFEVNDKGIFKSLGSTEKDSQPTGYYCPVCGTTVAYELSEALALFKADIPDWLLDSNVNKLTSKRYI